MNKKRTKLEVTRDILEIIRESRAAKITHLIYKANLSSSSIKPYLDNLIKNKMITQIDEKTGKLFKITEKGLEFLQEFNKMKVFSEAYGLNDYA
jgi:predicted transcriptional regulator